ncbi:MFS transporter [Streptomyces sp. NBC_01020]|uniref:MFS transporter n=1 Tax=unclassified Streptomyces TaxID=2593676 RepID=UPI002E23B6E7|nr:MFS transporter [Streptomyces sp. NBC_01020]
MADNPNPAPVAPSQGNAPSLDNAPSKGKLLAVLVLIILFSEAGTFEITMVYPALPDMTRAFQTLHIAWAASIVTLAGATVMPLVGKAADKWGKKRVILGLGVVFVLGSVICAIATSFAVLLVGRALQGCLVGIVTLSYSLVRDIMPRDLVPVALGTVVTGVGMAAVAGPFLSGWLIDSFGHEGVFWFLALYAAVLLPVYAAVVPESPVRVDRPVDVVGTVLLGPGIGVLLLGITQGGTWGWTAGSTLTCLILGTAMLAGFTAWERVCSNPLISLDVLLGRRFGPTVLAVACVAYMMNAHALISPTMLMAPGGTPGISYGAGLSATQLALWTFPLGIVGMFMGPLGGFLSTRIGARNVLLVSAGLFLLVMYLGSQLLTVRWQVALLSLTAGCAIGFLHSSNANLVQDALPASQSAVGNSIGGMVTLLSAGIATALTGVVMSGHVLAVDPKTHAVLYADSALTHSYGYAALVGAVGAVVVLVMRHGRAPAQGGLVEPEGAVRLTGDAPLSPTEAVG